MFPKVPQSSQTESLGLPRNTPSPWTSPPHRTLLALVFCLTHLLNGVRSSFVLLGFQQHLPRESGPPAKQQGRPYIDRLDIAFVLHFCTKESSTEGVTIYSISGLPTLLLVGGSTRPSKRLDGPVGLVQRIYFKIIFKKRS